MNFIIKLRNIFAFRNVVNKCFYLLLINLIFIYSIVKNNYYLLIICVLLYLIFIKYNKTLFLFSILMISVILINYYYRYNLYNKYDKFEKFNYGGCATVYKTIEYEDYQKVYIKCNDGKFYFNSKENIYKSGNILYIKGNVEEAFKNHYEHGFNYKEYLKNNGINGKLDVSEVVIIDKKFSLFNIHEFLNDCINKKFKSPNKEFIKTLLIGDKNTFDDSLYKNIQNLGIAHLFVISGLHMDIIKKFATSIMKVLKVNKVIQTFIIILLLLSYFIIAMYSVSILRVLIGFIIGKLKIFKKLSSVDKLSINASLVLLINPYYLFSYSFLLSYCIVFGIHLISPFLSKKKNIKSFLTNNLLISLISTIISLPIVITINPEINFLCLIYNLIFIPFVSYVLLPFTFLVFFIPPIELIYQHVINTFTIVVNGLSSFDIVSISFSHLNLFLIVIYYLLIFCYFNNALTKFRKVFLLTFILFIGLISIKPSLNPKAYISFISLPSGESTLIHDSFNKNNILIDTGDVDASELVKYLKINGIKTINSIIISHGDSDHIGGLRTLIKEFKVKNIYLSYYDKVSKKEVSNYNTKKVNIYYLKKGDEFFIDKFYFKILWPSFDQKDVNNNSLVIYSIIFNQRILFTGDIEKKAEEELVRNVNKIKVDILKVAHHGSNTSTHELFLKSVRFKIAVAMNGYNNQFGFPTKAVIDRIKNIPNTIFYNTIYTGTITIYSYPWSKKMKISTSFK